MKQAFVSLALAGFLIAPSAFAENKITTFVNGNGKVVFTNLIDNTPEPPPPILIEKIDVLAEEVPEYLRLLVDTISKNYGVDPGLVRAVIKTESNFNRFAVSHKGALGLMQLIPETGKRYGVRDFFDPQQNVDGGVRYLRFLLDKFNGNLDLSLAAYNAGENLVDRLGRIPPIPETTTYVRKIRAIYKPKSTPPAVPSITAMAAKEATKPAGLKAVDLKAKEPPKPEPSPIYKIVDERGVVHFSNVAPGN